MSAAASPERNKVVARRFIEEVVNNGNLAVIDELYDTNVVRHDPATPDLPQGVEGIRQLVTRYRAAFPDLNLAIEDMLVDGDKVVTRWRATGTHRGDLQGIAATGKQTTVTGIVIALLANGRIVEEWENWDTFGLMQQLGVVP